MNIIMICGSRSPKGKTATMAEALLRGAEGAGAVCERVYLPELAIERCRQCDEHGWGECASKGQCVIKDDLDGIVNKIRAAQAVVFATPVYFGDLSESLRAFLDRLRRVNCNAEAKAMMQGKRAVGICPAGGSGGGSYTCATSLETTLRTTGFDVMDVVPVRRQNMDLKAQTLETTGRWLAGQAG